MDLGRRATLGEVDEPAVDAQASPGIGELATHAAVVIVALVDEAALRGVEARIVVIHAMERDAALRRNNALLAAHQRVNAGGIADSRRQIAVVSPTAAWPRDHDGDTKAANRRSELHRRLDMAAGRVEQQDAA